ncbi:uncharacterized protein LOC117222128 isoform X2 [Megalopta genalis]|uniref:uncharacterized protein LOC117222128 isoform X2 n=1 Tax=Megalopta genalis TaxID=115081 RepID=UPI003FD642BD
MEMEQAYCSYCVQPIQDIELLQPEVRPRRRPKSQLQRCPSCHYSLEVPKHSSGKAKCYKNMETILDSYADKLGMSLPQSHEESVIRVVCGRGTSNSYNHSRKRQTSGHRCHRRCEEDQIFLADNVDSCCVYPQHLENGRFHDNWRDYKVKTFPEEYRKRKESRSSRQRRKDELENEHIRCQLDLLRCDSAETAGDDLENRRTQRKCYNNLNFLETRLGGRGTDDHDLAKGRSERSQNALNLVPKPGKRSAGRKHAVCKPEDESTNSDDEKLLQGRDQDARKNLYDAGDLNLRATKNEIVGMIDEVRHVFSSSTDQPKNVESTRGLVKEEPCVELTRALQGDCCGSLKDLLTHRGVNQDCIKHLKSVRWKHMNHIQDMFSQLCTLQKFLDTCSPRLSLSAPQTHTAAVEQRVEERQQQPHEEK